MTTRGWAAAALALTVACARPEAMPEAEREAGRETDPLAASLQVGVTEDSVRFTLYVTNSSAAPVGLEYSTAQRYDFSVASTDGKLLWRWSDDRMFAQVTGVETLLPGETLQYGATWIPGDVRGDLVASGELRASAPTVVRRMQFQIP